MLATLRRVTGFPMMLLLVLSACSRDAKVEDPAGPEMAVAPAVATVVLNDVTYEYGCPDFPCPVMPIVTEHINKGLYFWMEPGTFHHEAIYLYVLRTPVMMRRVTILPPPDTGSLKLPPFLTGPEAMTGAWMAPLDQLACTGVKLTLNSPDGREWNFVSGERILAFRYYGNGQPGLAAPMITPVFATDWDHLVAGHYGVYPGYGTPPYDATFNITVRNVVEGVVEEHVVSHTFACNEPEGPAPPAPYLTGPEVVTGDMLPDVGLVCSDFELTLVSPDGGEWYYDEGEIFLEYLRWGPDLKKWIPTGETSTIAMTPEIWDRVLNGTYAIMPANRSAHAYRVTFSGGVERDVQGREYYHEVGHKMLCVSSEPEVPAPTLFGPDRVKGVRGADLGLICKDFNLTLFSPDEGPWYYDEGQITLKYLRWGADLRRWIPTGETSIIPMTAGVWMSVLNGTYMVMPDAEHRSAAAYDVLFSGWVERDVNEREYRYPVSTDFRCVGPDFFDMEKPR